MYLQKLIFIIIWTIKKLIFIIKYSFIIFIIISLLYLLPYLFNYILTSFACIIFKYIIALIYIMWKHKNINFLRLILIILIPLVPLELVCIMNTEIITTNNLNEGIFNTYCNLESRGFLNFSHELKNIVQNNVPSAGPGRNGPNLGVVTPEIDDQLNIGLREFERSFPLIRDSDNNLINPTQGTTGPRLGWIKLPSMRCLVTMVDER